MPDRCFAILRLHHGSAVAAEAAACNDFYSVHLVLARVRKTANLAPLKTAGGGSIA